MSDNLFERLFELFQSPGPVNWKLAKEVTGSLVGAREPIDPALAEEYQELGLAAQLRLDPVAPFDVSGSRLPDPLDRVAWAEENEQGFRYLIEPLAGKLTPDLGMGEGMPMAGMLAPMGPAILGMQAGTMVGFMSHRVLGQFDTGVPALDHDRMLLVPPNVEAFASDHGLDARQVRLWATMHELAHHGVLGVEWMRARIVAVTGEFFAGVEFDLSGMMERLGGMQDPEEIESMLSGSGGMASLLGRKEQPEQAARVQALFAFIEGYVDYLVGEAAGGVLPDLTRIDEAYGRRKAEPNQAEQALQQLVGLDLQRHRSRDAAEFCREVDRRWGVDALTSIWDGPERLPTLAELTDPIGWAARVWLEDGLEGLDLGDPDD
jgi:putative hydrolase